MTQQIQYLSSVEHIMNSDTRWVLADESISSVQEMLNEDHTSPVAVVDHQHRFVGFVNAGDELLDQVLTAGQAAVRARMTVSPDESAFTVVSGMLEKNLDWVPVLHNRKLIGSLSRDCVLSAFGETRAV